MFNINSRGLTAAAVGGLLILSAFTAGNATAQATRVPSALAETASCRPYLDFLGTGIAIRKEKSTTSTILGRGNPGDCWIERYHIPGERYYCSRTGQWWDQWSYGVNLRTGVTGYVTWCWLVVP